jgi:fructokinase
MRIGIDLGGSKIEGIGLSADGRELARIRIPAPRGAYGATVDAVRGLVSALEEQSGHRASRVGIGIPGTVSPLTGLIKNANSTWLIGHPFDRDLEASLGRPVRVTNDANCFAVSEATDGSAAGARVAFGVILGTGVGGGITIDGRPLHGHNAIAGEWGHNPLPWPADHERPGRRCYCGLDGCIETFLSGPGLAADYQAATGRNVGPEEVVALAASGDEQGELAMARYENRLARALATVINLIDPDVIVLGGGLSKIQRFYAAVPGLWDPYVFSDHVTTELRPPLHGDASGVRGAAWLWPAGDED